MADSIRKKHWTLFRVPEKSGDIWQMRAFIKDHTGRTRKSGRAREQQIRQKLIASLEKSGSLKAGALDSPSPLKSLRSPASPLSMPAPTGSQG